MSAEDGKTITSVGYTQFGRYGKVELLQGGNPIGGMNLDGLDFKFNTSELFPSDGSSTVATATVSILGLSKKNVDYLCQFCDICSYKKNLGIYVRVSAGYETGIINGMQEIFTLPVVAAVPSMPPDNWVTMTARNEKYNGYLMEYNSETASQIDEKKREKPKNVMESMEDIGKALGINWNWHTDGGPTAATKHTIEPFSICGDVDDAVDMLRKKCPFLKFIHMPFFTKTTVYDVYLNELYQRGEDGKYKWTTPTASENVWTIDINHGMIGIPHYVGGDGITKLINVRTLLNPAYRPFDKVKLKSIIAPDLNTTGEETQYFIKNVSHTGHLRGNEWYSDIKMICGMKHYNK